MSDETVSTMKECPHCFSTIDDRATVCPQCRRDIASPEDVDPAKGTAGKGGGFKSGCQLFLVIALLIVLMAYGLGQAFKGPGPRIGVTTSRNCSVAADEFQQRADELMAAYLVVHRTGQGNKAMLRNSVRGLSEPSCARGAKDAVFDWFAAVDADNQAGMTGADERYLSALK